MSTLWLRLSATFHEHPKMLAVRSDAGSKADAAELGWYRILMASKRYGRWNFASESHLKHAAGAYYRFVPSYRDHGLLDGLTIHDGDSYNAIKSDAERKAEQRERDRVSHEDVTTVRDIARDQNVTLQTDIQTDREDRHTDDGRADLEAFLLVTRRAPTPKQRRLLDELVDRHDLTGPAWSADIMLKNPDDPIGAVIEADKAWRAERIAEAQAAERPKPVQRRPRGLPQTTKEIMAEMAQLRGETA